MSKATAGKYEKLDTLIFGRLSDSRPTPFAELYHGGKQIHIECNELADKKGEGFRVLDRRLQALRKKGLIANVSSAKGWIKIKSGGSNG